MIVRSVRRPVARSACQVAEQQRVALRVPLARLRLQPAQRHAPERMRDGHPPRAVSDLGVRAFRQQHAHALRVAVRGGGVERRVPVVTHGVGMHGVRRRQNCREEIG